MVKKKAVVVAFFILLGGMFALNITGLEIATELDGEYKTYERPAFSAKEYLKGSFQTEYERYISSEFANHDFLTKMYNQMRYMLFHTSQSVVVGKNGYLFETPYVEEVFGVNKEKIATDEQLEEYAQLLYEIQKLAKADGKAFLFLFTPNKVDFEQENLPDAYQNYFATLEPVERNYVRLQRLLDEKGVHYLDGTSILKENAEANGEVATYYKTGTHWRRGAAVIVMNEILDDIERQTDWKLKDISVDGYEALPGETDEQDMDLYRLLNVFQAEMDDEYLMPKEQVEFPKGYVMPRLFIQGGSFTNKLLEIVRDDMLFSEDLGQFYGISLQDYHRAFGVNVKDDYENEALKQAVKEADVILLECNVENVNALLPDMYQAICRHLSDETNGQSKHEKENTLDSSKLGSYDPPIGCYQQENDGTPFYWAKQDMFFVVDADQSVELTVEFPIDKLEHKYGEQLKETAKVYVNGVLIKELQYQSGAQTITLDGELSKNALGREEILVEIVAPYSFNPKEEFQTEDSRNLAYKLRIR